MKKILMFTMASCPYCQRAQQWMSELCAENPAYRAIPVEFIDEVINPGLANQYDYYYVPTYYVDGEKVHEGAATREIIKSVYEKAMAD